MSANKMIMCDMREDGRLHVMAFRHDDKVVADSFRITCMGKGKDFSIDKLVEFGDEKELEQFATESILPCLLKAFPDTAKKLSPIPICANICGMTIGREPPTRFS